MSGDLNLAYSMALRSTRSEILSADILLNGATNTPHINVGDLNVPLLIPCVRVRIVWYRLFWRKISSLCFDNCVLFHFSYSYRLEL